MTYSKQLMVGSWQQEETTHPPSIWVEKYVFRSTAHYFGKWEVPSECMEPCLWRINLDGDNPRGLNKQEALLKIIEHVLCYGGQINVTSSKSLVEFLPKLKDLTRRYYPALCRRVNELFGCQPIIAEEPIHSGGASLSTETLATSQMEEEIQCLWSQQIQKFNTPSFVAALQYYYPGLVINIDVLNLDGLNSIQMTALKKDLQFYMTYLSWQPRIPIENLCAQMDTFQVTSSVEHRRWKKEADRVLVDIAEGRSSGLFLQGESGTGKSHLAIAVAKECTVTHQFFPSYLSYGSIWDRHSFEVSFNDQVRAAERQNRRRIVWIIDDFEQVSTTSFQNLLVLAYERSDVILITACPSINFDELLTVSLGHSLHAQQVLRRAKEIFGLLPRVENDYFSEKSTLLNAKNYETSATELGEINQVRQRVTRLLTNHAVDLVLALPNFKRYYNSLDIEQLHYDSLLALETDLRFYLMTDQTIATEDVCAQLFLFVAKTEQQKTWRAQAEQIIESQTKRVLLLCGDAGQGKTHLAISIAKASMNKGFHPIFVHRDVCGVLNKEAHLAAMLTKVPANAPVIWILDDHRAQPNYDYLLSLVVTQIQMRPQDKLIITSNDAYIDYMKLINSQFPSPAMAFVGQHHLTSTRPNYEVTLNQNRFFALSRQDFKKTNIAILGISVLVGVIIAIKCLGMPIMIAAAIVIFGSLLTALVVMSQNSTTPLLPAMR